MLSISWAVQPSNLLLILLINSISSLLAAEDVYCSYLRRVDLSKFTGSDPADHHVLIQANKLLDTDDTWLPFSGKTLYSEVTSIHDTCNFYSDITHEQFEAFFSFQIDDLAIKLTFSNLKRISEKTVKFQLQVPRSEALCKLTVDFYTSQDSEYYPELLDLSDTVLSSSLVNYETIIDTHRHDFMFEINLRNVLAAWYDQEYSIICLKCNNNVALAISNNNLEVKLTNKSSEALFNDLIVQLDQYIDEDSDEIIHNLLNIRIYSPGPHISTERSKRYLGNKKLPSGSTYKLAISEETIGLQTKSKIYDHEWLDYQLNASDYVKKRIQIVSPHNLLNITKGMYLLPLVYIY